MDSLAQFEEWFACNYFDQYCTNIFALDEDCEYLHGQVSLAMKAWQASRAAMKQDLPLQQEAKEG